MSGSQVPTNMTLLLNQLTDRYMRRITIALLSAACMFAASCSPSAYSLLVDMRYPSSSGIDLLGRSMSVVYLQSEDGSDSLWNHTLADSFVGKLEEYYFDGSLGVDFYQAVKDVNGDYSSRDSLVRYVMDTGSDVVFLIDTPTFTGGQGSSTTAKNNIYVYDAMGKDDEVFTTAQSISISSNEDTANASILGKALSGKFAGTWQKEQYSLLYFDWSNESIDAIIDAEDGKWAEAIDIWLRMLDSHSEVDKSCAEYNIAVGCLMKGEYELASEWLDRSDADHPISLSSGLRKRINARLGR